MFVDYKSLVLSTLLAVCSFRMAESISCKKEPIHDEGRLRKQLFCGSYSADTRPVKDAKFAVNVSVTSYLVVYDYSESDTTLKANIHLKMRWTDEYLTWKPKDFSNISVIVVSSEDIWTPDLQLFSSYYKPQSFANCFSPSCQLESDGSARCFPSCDFDALCESDYTSWPLDTQICRMVYGAWMESSAEIDFHTTDNWVASKQTNSHTQWKIVSSTVSKRTESSGNKSNPVLQYIYVIERHSMFHLAALLTPIFVLVLLNLFLTWLRTDSIERKLLLAVSTFCHFEFLIHLRWIVPHNGETVPGMLIFFRDSMIITCLLLVQNVIAAAMKQLERTPPNIVILLTGNVAKTKVGELILAGDYMNVEYKETEFVQNPNTVISENRKTWTAFSRILDRALFFIFFGSYIVLFFIYVPLKYERLEGYRLYTLPVEDVNHLIYPA